MGLARPLSQLSQSLSKRERERVGRCLSVRYDGSMRRSLFAELATGLATNVKAFPVPGHLAGSLPVNRVLLATRLAGITSFVARNNKTRPTLSGDNSFHQTCPPMDPR